MLLVQVSGVHHVRAVCAGARLQRPRSDGCDVQDRGGGGPTAAQEVLQGAQRCLETVCIA